MNYYSNLFRSGCHTFPLDLKDLILSSITGDINAGLMEKPDTREIRLAVLSMDGNKIPGPDGMSPTFYKHYWHIIGEDIVSAVQDYYSGEMVIRAVNHTFITLIPKRHSANKVDQFRPIILCNVIYKIITKLIAFRLKPYLDSIIYTSQSVFIPNRSIIDNIIINHGNGLSI